MKTTTLAALALSAALLPAGHTEAAWDRGCGLSVEVDGVARPEYHGRGQVYVEAVRGKEYVLRVTNPFGVRVAVALAVDGLSTIDAGRSDAWTASKWVLGPYESIEIAGWQVSGSEARKFYFTGERGSYGAWLGRTEDLGVIEAVFFREKEREVWRSGRGGMAQDSAAAPQARSEASKGAPEPADDYAATGIGDRTHHPVERVALDLERTPAAKVRIRYEFRPQLIKLGLLPRHTSLDRRERARGFEGAWCPEPPGR
ncbi:MAG: hypothetical protein ACOY3Y_18685 [Acidobacteriota bacterium]